MYKAKSLVKAKRTEKTIRIIDINMRFNMQGDTVANGSGPHSEAKSRGNRNGVVENVSDVRDVEALLEVLLELGFPIRIIVIDGWALLCGLRRHAELPVDSARTPALETRIQVRKSMRAVRIVAGESEFGADRMREGAHESKRKSPGNRTISLKQCGSLDRKRNDRITEIVRKIKIKKLKEDRMGGS